MLAAAAGLLVFYGWGAAGLPGFGDTVSVYGTTINHVVAAERQVTNAVSAVVFDYRGYDTMGEELILFVSVVGVTLLLRERRSEADEITADAAAAEQVPSSGAIRSVGVVVATATMLTGLYVVAHGQLTPGGGFQGGIVLGAAFVLVYAAGAFGRLRRLEPAPWMELADAAGAAGLVLLGLGGLLAGGAFFHNFLSTGTIGQLQSGGIIPFANVAVGLEVMGATVLLGAEFLQDVLVARRQEQA
jgi:multicomponent Na+:H+ antiporter subunit B